MSGLGADSSNVPHEPPNMAGQIEIPASLANKLTPEQLDKLENHAKTHHDSRKHLAAMERHMSKGMDFEEAHQQALKDVGK